MAPQVTVVLSCSASRHPAKNELERRVIASLQTADAWPVVIISDLYDLCADSRDAELIRQLTGDIILACWMHPRAAFWTLDQLGIRGIQGTTRQPTSATASTAQSPTETSRNEFAVDSDNAAAGSRQPTDRTIDCLDLRTSDDPAEHLQVIQRLAGRKEGSLRQDPPAQLTTVPASVPDIPNSTGTPNTAGRRRWYPVIDFSRCTNCLECIDFCLFGVYGIDQQETILVEQPDSCRAGCPACSRVCPEQAIIFPRHKSPTISGDLGATGSNKLKLSALFEGGDAPAQALDERNQHLNALHDSKTTGPTQPAPDQHDSAEQADHDELDELIDKLDDLDSE